MGNKYTPQSLSRGFEAVNSFQAIAPLTAQEKGVHFLGEHISIKN
jgi:hypothetical protein